MNPILTVSKMVRIIIVSFYLNLRYSCPLTKVIDVYPKTLLTPPQFKILENKLIRVK